MRDASVTYVHRCTDRFTGCGHLRFALPGVDSTGVAYPKIQRDLLRKIENQNFPLIGLRSLVLLREGLGELEEAMIRRARDMGASTTDIGEALGITRQAAYQRLKQLEPRDDDVVVVPEHEAHPETTA